MSVPAVCRAEGIGLCLGGRTLLDHWTAEIPPGVTLVQGDEGTGKSTLLRVLAGVQPVDAGRLHLAGADRAAQPEAFRRSVFWEDPRTTAHDALTPEAYWDAVARRHPAMDRELLADLIEDLGLAPHLGKTLHMLSTGTRRKVWLAAGFACGAPLTLIDEPFASLDAPSRAVLRELLQEAARHPTRAWVLADYTAPEGVALASVIRL